MTPNIRIGQGFDVHPFLAGRKLVLGGIEIPHDKGLLGHSDADVLLHAVSDAILGALGLPDIGKWFPNDDERFRDSDSAVLLKEVWSKAEAAGWCLVNLDCTLLAERPKVSPYVQSMKERIAGILQSTPERIGIKATTTEKLGFVGREEGIAALAVVLLSKI